HTPMIISCLKKASAPAFVAMGILVSGNLRAQTFSHAVIVMTGTVRSDETARPTSVQVSIREAGDTAREITRSTSNKETGRYLVILQPAKHYWVHLEGDSILTKDVLISTPPTSQTQELKHDFTVVLREVDDAAKSVSAQN
ncbi:MAG: hypothetical protein ACYDBH_25080, partial [Acidobacteriaceae bacterium]